MDISCIEPSLNKIKYGIENGYHIILITLYLFLNQQYYFGNIFYSKMFAVNYYIHFSKYYKYPNLYRWKHMIRLTDTGHIAALLCYYDKSWLPITYNITFFITFLYWGAILLLGMKDEDDIKRSDINYTLQNIHSTIGHGSYLLWSVYFILTSKETLVFDNNNLIKTYLWVFTWLFFIYIPWVFFTGDYVYSVMKYFHTRIVAIILALTLILLANKSGEYLTNNIDKFNTLDHYTI